MEPKVSTKTGVAQKSDADAAMVARVAQRQRDGKPVFDPGCLQVENITEEICGVSPANNRYCVKRVKNAEQKRRRGRKAIVMDNFQERGVALIFKDTIVRIHLYCQLWQWCMQMLKRCMDFRK